MLFRSHTLNTHTHMHTQAHTQAHKRIRICAPKHSNNKVSFSQLHAHCLFSPNFFRGHFPTHFCFVTCLRISAACFCQCVLLFLTWPGFILRVLRRSSKVMVGGGLFSETPAACFRFVRVRVKTRFLTVGYEGGAV